jgi:hypothetical protein
MSAWYAMSYFSNNYVYGFEIILKLFYINENLNFVGYEVN